MNIDKFTITSYDRLMGFDRSTGKLDMILDELSDFTLSHEEEKVDITGKGGRTITSLKKNKKVTGKGTNGMLSGGALAAALGADVENGSYRIRFTDTFAVNANNGVTQKTTVGTAGNEIGTIYVKDSANASLSESRKLVQTSEAPSKSGTFSYNPENNEISFFAGDVENETEVIAFYDTEVDGRKITNDADHYSKTLQVVVDVTCQDGCDNVFHGQFIIDRADFNGTFDIQGGSDPSTLGFEFTSLPNLCTGRSDLWEFIVFDGK